MIRCNQCEAGSHAACLGALCECSCRPLWEHWGKALLQMQGTPADWPPAVVALFRKHVLPRFKAHEWVSQVNYFSPRPWRNEWDRGDPHEGFYYTLQPGDRVCLVEWRPE